MDVNNNNNDDEDLLSDDMEEMKAELNKIDEEINDDEEFDEEAY